MSCHGRANFCRFFEPVGNGNLISAPAFGFFAPACLRLVSVGRTRGPIQNSKRLKVGPAKG